MLFVGVHIEKVVCRKFTDEFKEGAVELVTDQGYKISEAARNLGLMPATSTMDQGKLRDSSPTSSSRAQLQAELNQLRR